jgi:penicillin amidase
VPRLRGLDLSAPATSPLLAPATEGEKEQRRREELEETVDAIAPEARRMLLEWDYHMEIDSAPAAVYGLFFHALATATFADQVAYNRWESASNRRFETALYYLSDAPDDGLWDDVRTPEIRETRDTVLVRAFRDGLAAGIELLGEDPQKWQWGDLHTIEFREPTLGESGRRFIENIFNLDPVPVPGSVLTVFHTGWKNGEPYVTNHSTSNRQIIDLGDLDRTLMIHAPGQSGHAKHRHYDDLLDTWSRAEYHPANWSREDAEEGRSPALVLTPAP